MERGLHVERSSGPFAMPGKTAQSTSLRILPTLGRLLVIAFLLTGCTESTPPAPTAINVDTFNGTNAFAELEAFDKIYPRDAATPGGKRAAEYIHQRMLDIGVESFIDAFEDNSPSGPQTFRNVFGRFPGRGKGLIIIGSHYDSKVGMEPGFTGANDSGSSTAVLLELARVLKQTPALSPEILLIHFDGEESYHHYSPIDGFHGSKHFAAQLLESDKASDVQAMILLDMVGDRDYSITIPRNGTPSLMQLAFQAAEREGIRKQFKLSRYSIGDDHEAFFNAGMPAIDLIDFEFGSAPGLNDYWHTPEDTIDKISAESLAKSGRITLHMINDLMTLQKAQK